MIFSLFHMVQLQKADIIAKYVVFYQPIFTRENKLTKILIISYNFEYH